MARYSGTKEIKKSWIYDTFRFEAGKTYNKVTFFNNPVGTVLASGVLKTFSQTNMHMEGLLAGISTFSVQGFLLNRGYGFPEKDIPEFIQSNCVLFIQEKPYPDFFPTNFLFDIDNKNVFKPSETLTGEEKPVTIKDIVEALERERKAVIFEPPYQIRLDAYEQFRFEIAFDSPYKPSAGFDLMIIFLGNLAREVM